MQFEAVVRIRQALQHFESGPKLERRVRLPLGHTVRTRWQEAKRSLLTILKRLSVRTRVFEGATGWD